MKRDKRRKAVRLFCVAMAGLVWREVMKYENLIGSLLLTISLLLPGSQAAATVWTDHYDASNVYSFAGEGISWITFDDWGYIGPCGQTYKDFQPCNGGFGGLGQRQHVVTLWPDRLTPDAPQTIFSDRTNTVYPNANMDGQVNFYKWGYTTPGFDIPSDLTAYRARDYSASGRQGCTFDMQIDLDGDYLVLKKDMHFAYIDTFSYVDATGVNPPQEVKTSFSFQPYPVSDAIGWCGSVLAKHPAALEAMGGQITFDFVFDAYFGDPPNRKFMGPQIVPKFEMRAYGTLKVHVWAGYDLQEFSSSAVPNNAYPGNTDPFDPDPNYYNRVSFHGGGVVPDGAWVSADSFNADGSRRLNDDGTWNVTAVPEGTAGAVWYKNAFAGYAFILRADALRMIDYINPVYGPEPSCTPVNCDDGNPCTADSCAGGVCLNKEMICPLPAQKCKPSTGACEPFDFCPAGVTCNDNNLCTTDSCDPAVGCVHKPVVCDDGNFCTADSCNPATGACVFTPVICNDVKACATNTCDTATGACKFTPVNCDDGNPLTTDTCDAVTGSCMNTPAPWPVNTTNNNFTMIAPDGGLTGGTNDVVFTWNMTKKTAVAVSGQVPNATLSSVTPFFGVPWMAHDVAIYGPGTYTVYADCPAGNPGCGAGTSIIFTVATNQLGAHMLFDWGSSTDIDVVNVWTPSAVFGPSPLFTGPDDGTVDANKVWDWMSSDWDGNGFNGYGMVDGPFIDFNANFNVMDVPSIDNPCADAATRCNDDNICTTDTCNTATGACVNTPIVCNDNNKCTTDACDMATGLCGYTTIVCDDNLCTMDTCNPVTGCVFTPKNCDDNNACTTDSCDTTTGMCVFTPADDGTVCSVNSQAGTCKAGQCIVPPPCPPGSVRSVTIRGGGQKPTSVDLQIQTDFTVVNDDGCIVDHTDSTVTVTGGTVLSCNFHAGTGPQPTDGTWKGGTIPTDTNYTITCPNTSGTVGVLYLDNKLGGGRDADRMTIKVQ